MNSRLFFSKQQFSIALIWLFHVSGLVGIIYSDASWFIKATPVNLLLSFVLLMINTTWSRKTLVLVLLCFITGMFAEIIGVHYGFLFGAYSYGDALGIKFLNVPLLIGVNWCILVFITGFIASFFVTGLWSRTLLGVFLMLFLDLVIEPVAPVLDFWTFESGIASFHNYFGWAVVALPLQFVFHKYTPKMDGPFPFHLFILQFLFFTILLLKINSLGI